MSTDKINSDDRIVVTTTRAGQKINPWVLFTVTLAAFIILTIVFIIVINKNANQSINYEIICNKDISSKYDSTLGKYIESGYEDKESYEKFIKSFTDHSSYKQDPTCVYMELDFLVQTNELDRASFKISELEDLYEQGRIPDARYLQVSSLSQLKERVNYFKAMQLEDEEESQPDENLTNEN